MHTWPWVYFLLISAIGVHVPLHIEKKRRKVIHSWTPHVPLQIYFFNFYSRVRNWVFYARIFFYLWGLENLGEVFLFKRLNFNLFLFKNIIRTFINNPPILKHTQMNKKKIKRNNKSDKSNLLIWHVRDKKKKSTIFYFSYQIKPIKTMNDDFHHQKVTIHLPFLFYVIVMWFFLSFFKIRTE